MASDLPQKESGEHPEAPAQAQQEATGPVPKWPRSISPSSTESAENKLRTASDVINRLLWDPSYDHSDFVIGYEDRFEGRLEASLGSWKKDLTDEEFIPQHRILYIKRRGGEVVWDRR
ncbi:hypothetical protein N7510_002675 [Penicillium lagena]|uniref:uncharacterized protein n=1 Tax=Penicillium lagena TaxID=94218 RepID=UPI00253FE61E|nr:uncharacterized protein N7510_002675 [Penicillium lagena]KAJ5626366.1 hypothetical protein N7510_002675 [Penicillium lagena]